MGDCLSGYLNKILSLSHTTSKTLYSKYKRFLT